MLLISFVLWFVSHLAVRLSASLSSVAVGWPFIGLFCPLASAKMESTLVIDVAMVTDEAVVSAGVEQQVLLDTGREREREGEGRCL